METIIVSMETVVKEEIPMLSKPRRTFGVNTADQGDCCRVTGEAEHMKQTLKTAAMALVISGLMMAQGRSGARATGDRTPPDPATRIANQVTRLTTLLDLTSGQASQATTILTNEQAALSALQTSQNTDQTALQTAIETNAVATIDQLAAAIGTRNGQVLSIRSKAQAALYAILTAPQQTKLGAVGGILALGGGPGGGPGGRGRGPGGPGPHEE